MEYIRKQFMELSQGSSLIMIKNYIFHTLPDMITSSFNPRIINHEYFAIQISMNDVSDIISAMQPSFVLNS